MARHVHDMAATTTSIGRRGESTAWLVLRDRGWLLLARNWHCRYAELDLICLDPAGEIVFVEVKYRMDCAHGSGLEAITAAKLRRMRLAASLWLEQARQPDSPVAEKLGGQFRPVRFDVIDVGPEGIRDHIEGAEL